MSTATATSNSRTSRRGPNRLTIKTWAFDSVGDKKYALQLQRASNGNPCLRIIQGSPQSDGSFRKFDITIWSEDFPALFENFEALRTYIETNDIKTPADHKYTPRQQR